MKSKTFKSIAVLGIVIALLLSVTACSGLRQSLDVIGNGSITAFSAVLDAVPPMVEKSEMNNGWSLSAPDGMVRFIWSEDWSKSPLYDVMLELDATPFMDAGLNPEKLPANYVYYKDTLTVGIKLGENAFKYGDDPTALAAYEQIANLKRDSISYHTQLDHYGITLGDGNMFEWAKDMNINDKDIVFVLNPQPLIAAGVDSNAVDGWIYEKVTVHVDGKPTEVDKFLKPFDIK